MKESKLEGKKGRMKGGGKGGRKGKKEEWNKGEKKQRWKEGRETMKTKIVKCLHLKNVKRSTVVVTISFSEFLYRPKGNLRPSQLPFSSCEVVNSSDFNHRQYANKQISCWRRLY